jgi:tRNA-uridine 2-sulfurtransferase
MDIAVGMSGGVDSSVAALLLKEQGHNVIGITMSIWDGEHSSNSKKNACYGPDEIEDIDEARSVSRTLGIPFHVIDCSKKYKNIVLDNFRNEYLSARTPNPCIVCNHKIKFGALLETAKESGLQFDYFATGHYAKVEFNQESGRFVLKKAKDKKKDQSYFLYRLSQEQLSKSVFPLSGLTKDEVRNIARKNFIHVSDKQDSQDFYQGDYKELLNVNDTEGYIISSDNKVIGKHKGFWNYTPGQRKGLNISYPEPLYVLKLIPETNTVVVGLKEEMQCSSFIVNRLNWISCEKPQNIFEASIKLRSSHQELKATIETAGVDELKITINDFKESISPGQSAVLYDCDTVIGGGIIDSVE